LNILVMNCGSSSLNYKVFSGTSVKNIKVIARGKAHRVGVKSSEPSFIEHHLRQQNEKITTSLETHQKAASQILTHLRINHIEIDAIGHRFVHGGALFNQSTLLSAEILEKLKDCLPLAPIHNPNSMSVISTCQEALPTCKQYVSFDTSFHSSMPPEAYTYAIPKNLREEFGFRRFGFHGLSYQYVTLAAQEYLKQSITQMKLIACHLGTGGSSVVAIKNGQEIDTSMGFTPLPGLMMSTRTGDLDAGIPIQLLRDGLHAEDIETLLNKKSGLLGVSGFSSDLRDILASQKENANSALAFDMYVNRLTSYIGAYSILLGGLDTLIFTDDIGLWSWQLRERVCVNLSWLGLEIDPTANQSATYEDISAISTPNSRATILVIPTDEELVVGKEGFALLKEQKNANC